MKNSIIRQLFLPLRENSETNKMTAEERKHAIMVSDTYDELLKELSPKQKELHEKFIDARESSFSLESDTLFAQGFKLGLLIGIECLNE